MHGNNSKAPKVGVAPTKNYKSSSSNFEKKVSSQSTTPHHLIHEKVSRFVVNPVRKKGNRF